MTLAGLPALVFTGLGVLGVAQVSDQGPDLAGIALIITAITGLIGTVGALVLGFRRKPSNSDALLELLLERDAQRLNKPENPS